MPEDKEALEKPNITTVTEHTGTKKTEIKKFYDFLQIRYVKHDVLEEQRLEHLGYKFVRKELNIISAKVEWVHYLEETVVYLVYSEGGDTTVIAVKAPTPLMAHHPASSFMVVHVIHQKSANNMPFYCQQAD